MALSIPIPWYVASPLAGAAGIGLIVAAVVGKWPHAPMAISVGGALAAAAVWLLIRGASGNLSGALTDDGAEATVTYEGLRDLDVYVILGLLVVGLIVGGVVGFAI